MRKNRIKTILASCGILCITSCGPTSIKIDETKTILNVYSFTSGFGERWAKNLCAAYEEAVKDVSFEEGKKGVQVVCSTPQRTDIQSTSIPTSGQDVLFLEQHDFYADVRNHYYADITDVVTEANPYDNGQKILDKLSASQKDAFAVDGVYYALPHYSTPFGIIYNIDLFEEKNYYFAETPSDVADLGLQGYFVSAENLVRSAGPDGVKGTSDDGLPSTYEEFFRLCDWIKFNNDYPVIFGQDAFNTYLSYAVNALAVDDAGYDEANLFVSLSGTSHSLAKLVDGKLVMDENPTEITPENKNGKELRRNAGYYRGLSFLHTLLRSYQNQDNPGFLYKDCFSNSNFLTAQKDFVQRNDVAMLFDGMWAENEADEEAHAFNKGKSRSTRKLGWMPLPKSDSSKIGTGQTLYDIYFPMAFVNESSNDLQKKVAKDFLQFAYSDAQLVAFTKTTGALKSVRYEIPQDVFDTLNAYGKSTASLKNQEYHHKGTNFVYPLASHSIYRNNHAYFDIVNGGGLASLVDGVVQSFPATYLYQHKDNDTAHQTYFEGMAKYAAGQPFYR